MFCWCSVGSVVLMFPVVPVIPVIPVVLVVVLYVVMCSMHSHALRLHSGLW